MSEQDRPDQPPRPPHFAPGHAPLPPQPEPDYPPTEQFPPVNYAPPGYAPDYGYPPPASPPPGHPAPTRPPRRSNTPLVALILAVTVLLCGGTVTAGVLFAKNMAQKAEEVINPITTTAPESRPEPTAEPSARPTAAPEDPADLPGWPTDLPELPDLPGGRQVTVVYEVTGDGPVQLVYAADQGKKVERPANVRLPWKTSFTMKGLGLVSVFAMRTNADDGSITCRAIVDGKTVSERTTTGPLASAVCYKVVFE